MTFRNVNFCAGVFALSVFLLNGDWWLLLLGFANLWFWIDRIRPEETR